MSIPGGEDCVGGEVSARRVIAMASDAHLPDHCGGGRLENVSGRQHREGVTAFLGAEYWGDAVSPLSTNRVPVLATTLQRGDKECRIKQGSQEGCGGVRFHP